MHGLCHCCQLHITSPSGNAHVLLKCESFSPTRLLAFSLCWLLWLASASLWSHTSILYVGWKKPSPAVPFGFYLPWLPTLKKRYRPGCAFCQPAARHCILLHLWVGHSPSPSLSLSLSLSLSPCPFFLCCVITSELQRGLPVFCLYCWGDYQYIHTCICTYAYCIVLLSCYVCSGLSKQLYM